MDEIEYGTFECTIEECSCEFGNSSDLKVHMESGQHGRIGDRFAEQNRRKFKYFSRQGRIKESLYLADGTSSSPIGQENKEQQSLNK